MGNPLLTLIQDRYRAQAIRTASERNLQRVDSPGATANTANTTNNTTETGGLGNIRDGGGSLSAGPPTNAASNGGDIRHGLDGAGGGRSGGGDPEKSTHNDKADAVKQTMSSPLHPPIESETPRAGDSAIIDDGSNKDKPPILTRMKNGSMRFGVHFKNAICHSYVNVLLVAVPAGIAVKAAGLNPAAVFAINAVAIVPLAGLLSHATESVASRLGDTLGALLNVSFGNAVELIIFIIALVKNEIRIVQASLLGSILANLLLILGMAFLLGGLRYREQVYNSTVTQMSACLLSLSVMSLLLPTAFHASFNEESIADADTKVLKVSRGTSIVLLIVYILYLLFQLKSHAYMYESTPQEIIDEESHPGILHDMMNASSSSDSSSSSSSSDSDTSASGSVATTSKRVKRMFKHKKRRKSSASGSSSRTASNLPSIISSPSTENAAGPDFFKDPSRPGSRRGSTLAAIASGDEADADKEDNGISRVFDWAKRHNSNDGSKSPELSSRRKKRHAKKKGKKHRHHKEEQADPEKTVPVEDVAVAPTVDTQIKGVTFDDEVQTAEAQHATKDSPSKLGLNVRQLSSLNFRPQLPTYLSNTVFSSNPQPVVIAPATRQSGPVRSQSISSLRRTSSLPDRLNTQTAATNHTVTRTDPLPPYQHQRIGIRKVNSGASGPGSPDGEDINPNMSRTAAVVLLLCSTGLVAICAEFMVDAIPEMIKDSSVGEAFIGLIILPIVGNAAEHVTAVTVAAKNKMDLAIGVAVGSSIQIALFVTPIVVLLGWILNTNMSLYFNLFETISLFVTAFVVNFLVLDGRSNYLEGSLLIAAYVIIALAAFFYPSDGAQSAVGGGGAGVV